MQFRVLYCRVVRKFRAVSLFLLSVQTAIWPCTIVSRVGANGVAWVGNNEDFIFDFETYLNVMPLPGISSVPCSLHTVAQRISLMGTHNPKSEYRQLRRQTCRVRHNILFGETLIMG